MLVGSKFVYPLTRPGGIGPRLNISSVSTIRIVGEVALSNLSAFGATNCLLLFEPGRPTRLVVGSVVGATRCSVKNSAANRARHERLCPDQPQAAVVNVGL